MNATKTIRLEELTTLQEVSLLGSQDRNLEALSQCFAKEIFYRDQVFTIHDCSDEMAKQIEDVLMALYEVARKNMPVSEQDVIYACRLVAKSEKVSFNDFSNMILSRTLTGKAIAPKTNGQMRFVKAMNEASVVFALGPAGTGKTFLAVIKAVAEWKKGNVKRIVLTRPAVEAGESLGFLPGDMKEKVDPYLTPLYDALHDMLGVEQTEKLIEKEVIEIAPLAYMRGRTLDDSFIILDEAQNTTSSQMKMFLTRLGFNSHMVITGDTTQIDLKLPHKAMSGLVEASKILQDIDDIEIVHLSADDVVRHPLVQKMIERYEEVDK